MTHGKGQHKVALKWLNEKEKAELRRAYLLRFPDSMSFSPDLKVAPSRTTLPPNHILHTVSREEPLKTDIKHPQNYGNGTSGQ
jgi:hypothetical protein